MGRYALPALFTSLTAGFAVISYKGATHGNWVVAIAAAAIGAWMATFALSALRRMRR